MRPSLAALLPLVLTFLARPSSAYVPPWPLPRADVARTGRGAYVGPRVLTPIPASGQSFGHGTLIGGDPASYASNALYSRVCFSSCTGDAAADDAIRVSSTGTAGETRRGSGSLTSHALTAADALVFMQNKTVTFVLAQGGLSSDVRWTTRIPDADERSALGVLPALGAVLVPLVHGAGFVALDADTGDVAWTSAPPVPTLLFPQSAVLSDAVVDESAGRLYQLACNKGLGTSLSVVTVKMISGATTASPGVYTECSNYTSLVLDDGLLYATGVRDAFVTPQGAEYPSVGFAIALDPNDPGGTNGGVYLGAATYVNQTLSSLACSTVASFCVAILRPAGDVVVLGKPALVVRNYGRGLVLVLASEGYRSQGYTLSARALFSARAQSPPHRRAHHSIPIASRRGAQLRPSWCETTDGG